MSTVLLTSLMETQTAVNMILSECISAVSPCSEEGIRVSQNELMRIKRSLMLATERIEKASRLVYKDDIVKQYNDSLVHDIPNCPICEMVDSSVSIGDIVHNPLFPISVFSIKNLLETIDDKIAEQDHNGIKGCLTSIAHELDNFPQLREVSQALYDVRDTFVDIVMVSDMMFDFEKFYQSVFILHDELNVGIALGSIKSVLPAPEEGSGMEFF